MGGLGMNPFGAAVVADLCGAIADLVDADPVLASKVARKLGSTLTSRIQLADRESAAQLELEQLRAKSGRY